MQAARALILYNEPVLSAEHPDAESEHEILYTVDNVSKVLLEAGFEVGRLGVGRDVGAAIAELGRNRPDAIFNLYEGTADHGETEAYLAGLLEWMGLPFTGSPAQALWQARCKHLTKYLLQGAGLPTPNFFVVDRLPVPQCMLRWPVIVKPALEDASVGIDHQSVVSDQARLTDRVEYLLDRYGPPVLVEQFIRGREFNVSLIEAPDLRPLPVSETVFGRPRPPYWPIVTYDAKWRPETRDFQVISARCPAEIDPGLAERLSTLACQAFRLLDCRGYGRIDFRVSASGRPYAIDVNPNSDLSPLAGLASGLEATGISYAQFIVDLVRSVLAPSQRRRRLGARLAYSKHPIPAAEGELPAPLEGRGGE
jgi:D-alanine-D-alanine ligase